MGGERRYSVSLMSDQQKKCRRPGIGAVLLQAGIPAAVGLFLLYRGRTILPAILFGVAAVMLVSGLLIPALFIRIEKAGQALGRGVSVALTWILLVPFYFLVFVPGRLILMARGIDPLCRQFPTDAPTYWVPRKPVGSIDEYKRQY